MFLEPVATRDWDSSVVKVCVDILIQWGWFDSAFDDYVYCGYEMPCVTWLSVNCKCKHYWTKYCIYNIPGSRPMFSSEFYLFNSKGPIIFFLCVCIIQSSNASGTFKKRVVVNRVLFYFICFRVTDCLGLSISRSIHRSIYLFGKLYLLCGSEEKGIE